MPALASADLCLLVLAFRDSNRRVGLIDLIDRHILLSEQRLNPVKVVRRVGKMGTCGRHVRLSPLHGRFRHFHCAGCRLDGCLRCSQRRAGGFNGAILCRDFPSRIDNSLFKIVLIGQRLLQRVPVIARVDLKQQITLFYKRVVFDRQ